MGQRETVPNRPAFYARISQDRAGLSVGVTHQIEEGKEFLAALGWPEPVVYEDNDISARGHRSRPGFERLIADLESGVVDGLAARHLDRLLRRVTDLERVLDAVERHRRPVPVRLVQGSEIDLSSASGRLLARILASVAANESEIKGERVGAARRREAQAGRAHGHLGYGYDENQNVVAQEAAIVREVADQLFQGRSLRAIAGELNERHIPTPGAGRWDARRVQKAVTNADRPALIDLVHLLRGTAAVSAATVVEAVRKAHEEAPVATSSDTTVGQNLRDWPPAGEWTAGWVTDQRWAAHLQADDHGLDDSTIAEVLRAALVAPEPTLWRAANLRTTMRRGALCGWREFSPGRRGGSGQLVAQGTWTPILSKDAVERIRRLTDRPGVRGREPKHLLAGVLKCGVCGSSMGGSPDGRGGTRYACSKQPGLPTRCGGLTVAGAPVDAMVSQAVIDTLADAGIRQGTKRTTATPAEVAKAQKEIAEIDRLREEYLEESLARRLRPAELGKLLDGLGADRRAAERVVEAWAPSAKLVLRDIPAKRPQIRQWWDAQPVGRRREVITVLIDSIAVAPARGRTRFDPTRIGDPVWKV